MYASGVLISMTVASIRPRSRTRRCSFQLCFRDALGTTAHDYLTQLRLQRAKELLSRGTPVTEVCMSVGFSSLGTFSGWFTRGAGSSPVRWQRAARCVVPVPVQLVRLWIPCCFLRRFAPSTDGEVGPGRAC